MDNAAITTDRNADLSNDAWPVTLSQLRAGRAAARRTNATFPCGDLRRIGLTGDDQLRIGKVVGKMRVLALIAMPDWYRPPTAAPIPPAAPRNSAPSPAPSGRVQFNRLPPDGQHCDGGHVRALHRREHLAVPHGPSNGYSSRRRSPRRPSARPRRAISSAIIASLVGTLRCL